MPKINEQNKTIVFDADDWLSGEDNIRNTGSRDFGVGMNDSDSIDPYRKYGYLSPSRAADTASNSGELAGSIANITMLGNNGYAIETTIGNLAQIHKIDDLETSPPEIINTSPYPHVLPSGVYRAWDITTYAIGTTEYVFYSWSSGTDWNVGRINVSSDTFDDDFMSTVPATPLAAPYVSGGASNVDHPMYVASNNRLYIGDRNFVHSFDGQTGANGTFEANVLDLPQGYQIVDFLEWNNYLVVFANNTSKTIGSQEPTAFFWDTVSESFTFTKSCGGYQVHAAKIYQNSFIISVSGGQPIDRKGNERLRIFNGSEFIDFAYFGTTWRYGLQVYGTTIYLNTREDIRALKEYGDTVSSISIASMSVSSSPFVKIINQFQDVVYSVSLGGDDYSLLSLSSSFAPSATCRTKSIRPYFSDNMRGQIRKIKIYFANETVANTLNLTLACADSNGNATDFYSAKQVTKRIMEVQSNTSGGSLPIFDLQFIIATWAEDGSYTAAPEIEKIVMYYENINVE
jgi:hypothetical protein